MFYKTDKEFQDNISKFYRCLEILFKTNYHTIPTFQNPVVINYEI